MSFIITAHSCGGSMAEAAQPTGAIGPFARYQDAVALANAIYEHASQNSPYDDFLTCVVEIQDPKGFIPSNIPTELNVGPGESAVDAVAMAKAMFGDYYDE